jgi:clan AA aspartic protease
MVLPFIKATAGKGKNSLELEFLVDSGAKYTLLPEKAWKQLDLKPIAQAKFVLADGTLINRKISEVWFDYNGIGRTVQIIMGEGSDEALLGVLTLEAMGLMLNPFTRELLPMKLMLAKLS